MRGRIFVSIALYAFLSGGAVGALTPTPTVTPTPKYMKINSPLMLLSTYQMQFGDIKLSSDISWFYNNKNGHFYGVTSFSTSYDSGISRVKESGGYLAVIESAEENDWILNNVIPPIQNNGAFIGLSGYDGEWFWDDGSLFNYSNWQNQSPILDDDTHYGIFDWNRSGKWRTDSGTGDGILFLIEAEVQVTQIGTSLIPGEWIKNPANGHYYSVFDGDNPWEWHRKVANIFGAYLVSINSISEQEWIVENFLDNDRGYFIGLILENNDYEWSSGESFSYNNIKGDSAIKGTYGVIGYKSNPIWHFYDHSHHAIVEYDEEYSVNLTPTPTATPIHPKLFWNEMDGLNAESNQGTSEKLSHSGRLYVILGVTLIRGG